MQESKEEQKPRFGGVIEAADHLSLGISIVVAVLIGVGIGLFLKQASGVAWTLWVGVAIGIAAAILNVYKAYSKQYREFEALAKERKEQLERFGEQDDDEDEDFGRSKI